MYAYVIHADCPWSQKRALDSLELDKLPYRYQKPNPQKSSSAPAPKLNCFNKVEMVVYAYNMTTWLRQEDDHKDILNTELTESNLSSLKTTNKQKNLLNFLFSCFRAPGLPMC